MNNYTIVDLEQNTAKWLEFRKGKIGASDCPFIMGTLDYKSKTQLWREKVGLDSETISNFAMERGKKLEPEARSKLIEITGIDFSPKVIVSNQFPWMMASLDGLSSCQQYACEIKCPLHHCNPELIKQKYYPQIQDQMYLLGLNKIYLFVYFVVSWEILEVSRDNAYIDSLLEEKKKFFHCCETAEPPHEDGWILREDDEWKNVVQEWISLQPLLKKEKELKEKIIELAQNQNSQGFGVKISKVTRKGSIDYERIIQEKLKDVDLEAYRKNNIESWRIGVN